MHVLIVTMFKSGTGFKARCSCGAKMGHSTGCNRGGLDYGLAQMGIDFGKHVARAAANSGTPAEQTGNSDYATALRVFEKFAAIPNVHSSSFEFVKWLKQRLNADKPHSA
jgi:hypothetical protein